MGTKSVIEVDDCGYSRTEKKMIWKAVEESTNCEVRKFFISWKSDFNLIIVCICVQNLYISTEISDEDVDDLVTVLSKSKSLWAVSLQNCADVTQSTWNKFSSNIPNTNLTHFFAESITVNSKLRKSIINHLRDNRIKCTPAGKEFNRKAKGMW